MVKLSAALVLGALLGTIAVAHSAPLAERNIPVKIVKVKVVKTVTVTMDGPAPTDEPDVDPAPPVVQPPVPQKPQPQKPQPQKPQPESGSLPANWQIQILQQVNAVRARAGLAPLSLDAKLNKIAQGQAAYQARVRSMTHDNPQGSLGTRLSLLGAAWRAVAENIAEAIFDVDVVMKAWINSPAHLSNMLGSAYTKIGVGMNSGFWAMDLAKF
ncbi:hypothetical protein H4R18_002467 [Coemansia javaensis]|uniref:SCP domain-containing protein n=1 Tax=Coemansia javaensis TaxID=2761396 RepID=A0A9W8HBR3_9FUNG|nr:hypothetical protein H4R18_002467 [Coemansia javaensis]